MNVRKEGQAQYHLGPPYKNDGHGRKSMASLESSTWSSRCNIEFLYVRDHGGASFSCSQPLDPKNHTIKQWRLSGHWLFVSSEKQQHRTVNQKLYFSQGLKEEQKP